MAYDEQIDTRIRRIVSSWENTDDKRMFGGVCHLVRGNMFCGVYKGFLILRLGEENAEDVLRLSSVKPFDITGRPMRGWVMVNREGFQTDSELRAWLDKAREFAETLPSK
jgi:TfoX/Sxy family transcriptional regulator of competence genes